jgi:hypothetical protein
LVGFSRSYLCEGSSSFDDPDVVEVSPAVATAAGGWGSGHQKRKRSQVIVGRQDDPFLYLFAVHLFLFLLQSKNVARVIPIGLQWEEGWVIPLNVDGLD